MNADQTDRVVDTVREAHGAGKALRIEGTGTKSALGRPVQAPTLSLADHAGVVSFEPTELVLTARSGTPIRELEKTLAEADQMMPFDPPRIGEGGTLGGVIAAALSGPRRPYAGSARDMVLGVRLVNGKGEALRFGGEVMKNVAGYDVSRLMTGAHGTLGVLLDVSMKVLPAPASEQTRVLECDAASALRTMDRLAGRPLPISAMAWADGLLRVRLSGTTAGVASAHEAVGGEADDNAGPWWDGLRDMNAPFFEGDAPLWRLAVPPGTAPISLTGDWLLDWGGTQRWLRTRSDASVIREATAAVGGHATCWTGHAASPFHPLPEPMLALHQRLKDAFDPARVLNPGRMYPEI